MKQEIWTAEQAREYFNNPKNKEAAQPTKKRTGSGKKYKAHLQKVFMVHGLSPVKECQFHSKRKFRFDYCLPAYMLAVEYEGLMSKKSRHTTATGFSMDTTKYNAAQSLGWTVLRYTALTYLNFEADLIAFMATKGVKLSV